MMYEHEYEALKKYFNEVSDEEIIGYFSAFTDEEIKGEFSEHFLVINHILYQKDKDKDDYVYKFFLYRGKIVQEKSDDDLKIALDKIISANEKAWKDYTGGKDHVIGKFIGLLMKESKVNAQVAKSYIEGRRKL